MLGRKIRHLKEVDKDKIYVMRFVNDQLKGVLEIANERYNRWNDITLRLYNKKGKLIHTWCDDSYYLYIEKFDDLKKFTGRQLWEMFVWENPE